MLYDKGFSIVCPTFRPLYIDKLVQNFLNQKLNNKELIVIINSDDIKISDFDKYSTKYPNIKVYKLPSETNLGECLNFGIDKSRYSYIAKFDDDDYYSENYLQEMFETFSEQPYDIIGKAKLFIFFEQLKELRLLEWGMENRTTNWIGGSTICFKREVFDKVRFRDIPSAVDKYFLLDCIENNFKIYAASRFNHILYRSTDHNLHTWKVDALELAKETILISKNLSFEECKSYANNQNLNKFNIDGFSVITCIDKINNGESAISNFINQEFIDKELILIINKDSVSINSFDKYTNRYPNIKVYKLSENISLGECLNFAVSKASFGYVAKFNKNDYYSKYYLEEAYTSFKNQNCDVVGKSKYFFYLKEVKQLRVLDSLKESDTKKYIVNGTICFNIEVFKSVKFSDVTLGADNIFIEDCIHSNIKLFSTSKFNHIMFIDNDHFDSLYQITSDQLLNESNLIARDFEFNQCFNFVDNKDIYFNKTDGFSIITPTCRAFYKERLISNYLNQSFKNKELIIIINNDSIDINDFSQYIKLYPNIRVYKLPESTTLGDCLNFGVSKSNFNYIAKFDDDDYYGKHYLNEVYNAFKSKQCDVVGKVKIHYYFDSVNELRLLNWGEENTFVEWIAGPTICFKKEVFEKVKFKSINLGEDGQFCKDCVKNKFKIYATSRYNYIIFRAANINIHTWKASIKDLIIRTTLVIQKIRFEDCKNRIDKI